MGKDAGALARDTWELIVKRRHTQHENWHFYAIDKERSLEMKNKVKEEIWRASYAPDQWRLSLELENMWAATFTCTPFRE